MIDRSVLVVALVAVALIWALVLLLDEPVLYAALMTLLAVVGVAASAIPELARARRGARLLEADFRAQAARDLELARPDQSDEVAAMRERFLASLGSLRSSKLGKQGFDALYAMPWYMIVGPPGAGKTTAIANSGLEFPVNQRSAMEGMGGTRNCQWWLANEAVLLDTAGRYAVDESDRDEWFAVLDLVRRSRPRKPIDGVLVAIGVDDLGAGDEDAAAERGRQLRARIDEIMGRLDMVAPVYVLFTKCDLIPGFIELFGDLGKQPRAQIWGYTVPTQRRGQAWSAQSFAAMVDAASAYALGHLAKIRQPAARLLAHGLPAQLQALEPNMRAFVDALFAENVYQETPLMRGVYLTSGTQEGAPIDRLLDSMVRSFNVGPQLALGPAAVERKSYFLGDVFTRVVFPDHTLAVRSSRERRRARRLEIAGAATLGTLGASLGVYSAIAYAEDAELIGRARDAVEALRAQPREAPRDLPADMLRLTTDLHVGHDLAPPFARRLGLDHSEHLRESLARLEGAVHERRGDHPEGSP